VAVPGTEAGASAYEMAVSIRTVRTGGLPSEPRRWQPREALVERVRRMAERGAADGAACVLLGLPGMGKTQLAGAYARSCSALGWPVVAWISIQPGGDEQEQVVRQLARLGRELGAAQPQDEPKQAATKLLAWLRRRRESSLLVYDNIRNPAGVRPWLPTGGAVQAVVTGKQRNLQALGGMVEVGVFTPDEAREFLAKQTGAPDEPDALRLAQALDFLPLTVAQAAGYVAGQRVGYGQYLDRWRSYRTHPLLGPGNDQPYRRGIAAAILLALAGVEDHTPEAWYRDLNRALLESLSVLSPEGARHQLLCAAVAPEHHHNREAVSVVRSALIRLADAALVAFDDGGRNVTAHPTVARLVRARALQSGTMGWVLARSASGLIAGEPPVEADEQGQDEVAAWGAHAEALGEQLVELAQHTPPPGRVDPAVAGRVLELQGAAVFRLSGLDLAKPVLEFAQHTVGAHEKLLGSDHPDTLACQGNLAFVYGKAGRTDESIALYEKTLADYERVLGVDHPDTFTSRNNLAYVYGQAGRTDESIELYERTLAECEQALGPDQPDTVKFQINLADAYESAGRLDEAVELYAAALAGCERLFGPNAPDTRDVRGNLAFACESAGRFKEAIDLYETSVVNSEFALGPNHRETLTLRNNLAYAYESAGRIDDAIDLYKSTLADRQRFLGLQDEDTLASYNNLAYAYEGAGQLEEARKLYEIALLGRESTFGPNHPTTIAVRHSLAGLDKVMAEQGRRGISRLRRNREKPQGLALPGASGPG
jgi:tetratricopeptide (TPR) repeat protein